ncbi:unnamed protein product [Adineta ricciae]|uniref:NADP-dependent oxidoreductase domain-containing protein n=1 Tax=Adineta ricciae TaxID=249248 RepID=A0A814L6N7_ADIRI|nr:unnamed protein product [Adineta ricciae]CAF1237678.1 unnamed protein product [Adineta ricciae]
MAVVPTRQLGKNGPQVSAIGFGAMTLSFPPLSSASDDERFKIIDRAIELGCTYIDSADVYGDNEELFARYFKKYPHQRKKVFFATKFANIFANNQISVRGDAQYVREASAKSFKRLELDQIDLYYVHRIDKNIPIEETMSVLKELVQVGKVKYLGLSECSSDTLRRAHAVHPISAVQVEYSPFSLEIEHADIGLLKTCRELGVAIVCYSPLGRGMLTGQIKSPNDLDKDDRRRHFPRFSEENFPKNIQLVNKLASIAQKKGCTSGQLTLAWILAQGNDFIPIPGTTKIKNLEENAAAAQIKLSKEDIAEIRQACESADIAGNRYPEAFAVALYGDSAPKKK